MPARTSSALGRCFTRWSAGRRRFEGDSKMSTLAAILKQEPKPISQLVPDIPPDLEKIINRCLRKDPERRFQHMADVKVDAGGTEGGIRLGHSWPGRQPRFGRLGGPGFGRELHSLSWR